MGGGQTCLSTKIGLRLFAAENAEASLEANKESLKDVAQIASSVEGKSQEESFEVILCNYTATMSDQVDIMKCFNKKLTDGRENIIKSGTLSQQQKEKAFATMENHHRSLHIIMNHRHNACKNGLKDVDTCFLSNEAINNISWKGSSTT